MVAMTNRLGNTVRLRRAAGTYVADPGETIEVDPRDVPTLRAIGFVEADPPDEILSGDDTRPMSELRRLASEHGISGRSKMTRDELEAAVAPFDEE